MRKWYAGQWPWCWWKEIWKIVSIFSTPTSIQLGVALAQIRVAFCEHWDETLVVAVFKHHHSAGMVIYNFRNCFLVLKWHRIKWQRYLRVWNEKRRWMKHGIHQFSFLQWMWLGRYNICQALGCKGQEPSPEWAPSVPSDSDYRSGHHQCNTVSHGCLVQPSLLLTPGDSQAAWL